MNPQPLAQIQPRTAPRLAAVGESFYVGQIKRRLQGFGLFDRVLYFWIFRPLARYCTRRGLPAMVTPDLCWEESQGVYTTLDGAVAAIAGRPGWFWKKLPVNGLLPDETITPPGSHAFPSAPGSRLQTPDSRLRMQCPYNGLLCNPADELRDQLVAAVDGSEDIHRRAAKLVRSS